jgi:hypothetical protein
VVAEVLVEAMNEWVCCGIWLVDKVTFAVPPV